MKEIFEVEESKCLKCGACVRDCAFRALRSGDDGLPRLAFPDRCMRCQHCLAVCPVGAVTFDGRRPEDSLPVKGLALPGLDAVENWMRTRRSMRRFAAEDVDRATLERILKVLGNTPTGCNARALTFTCFPTRKAMDGFRNDFIKAIEQHREGTRRKRGGKRWIGSKYGSSVSGISRPTSPATRRAMGAEAVSPGDSMPIRLTRPGQFASSLITKSRYPPSSGGASFGRIPA